MLDSLLLIASLSVGPRGVALPDPCKNDAAFATMKTQSGAAAFYAATAAARAKSKRCAPVVSAPKIVDRKPLVSRRTNRATMGSSSSAPLFPGRGF